MSSIDYELITVGFGLFLMFYYLGVCVFSFYDFSKI